MPSLNLQSNPFQSYSKTHLIKPINFLLNSDCTTSALQSIENGDLLKAGAQNKIADLFNKIMAGTLPGVEAARRRRFHHGASDSAASWVRKSSFRREFCSASSCASSSSLRSACYGHEHHLDDEMLGGVAREAKERLDEKLRNQRKMILVEPINIRNQKKEAHRVVDERQAAIMKHEDVAQSGEASAGGLKRSGSKRLMGLAGWTKLGWKASEQEECAICLDRLNSGVEALATLPCAHRFHSKCLAPWIESNAHCPCCRMSLTSSNNAKSNCKF